MIKIIEYGLKLGTVNFEDPRLDILVKVVRGKELYRQYTFLANYKDMLAKTQKELEELTDIKNQFALLSQDDPI